MRTILSTLRRPGRARATRRLRSSSIGAVAGADLAMANQITNPLVGAMVGVQVAAEDANNASIGPVTEFD